MSKREPWLIAAIAVLSCAIAFQHVASPAPNQPQASIATRLGRVVGLWLLMREPAPPSQDIQMAGHDDSQHLDEPARYATGSDGVALLQHGAGW